MGWKEERSGMGGKWEGERGGEGWGIGRSRERRKLAPPDMKSWINTGVYHAAR